MPNHKKLHVHRSEGFTWQPITDLIFPIIEEIKEKEEARRVNRKLRALTKERKTSKLCEQLK